MPSPSFDPWLNSRRFAITIDAGSSGSRLQIYSWLHPSANDLSLPKLSVIERGTKDPNASVIKIEPGISSFSKTPGEIAQHLAPLLQHARDHIPPSLHSETPLFLYATAGMRLLPQQERLALLDAACHFLRFHSNFRVTDDDSDEEKEETLFRRDISSSRAVTCKNHVRVITGEEEGLFGWIAVNYLLNGFTQDRSNSSSTYGFLDMGGASAQMAFQAEPPSLDLPLIPVNLNLLNGESIHCDVFVTTWLGYGTNQARERYVRRISGTRNEEETTIPDPCLPRGLTLPIVDPVSHKYDLEEEDDPFPNTLLYLRGTGSFDECQSFSAELLTNGDNISYPMLPFTPPLKTTPFVGVSEYWYTSEHVFGLGGVYDDAAFENAARKYCAMEWSEIGEVYLHGGEHSALPPDLGLDSDLNSNSKSHSNYNSGKIDIHRLEMQCFKAAWIMNVLHLGLGMPRVGEKVDIDIDEDVNVGTLPHLKPMFQSVDTIHDTAISWTLGKIVLQASREVGKSLRGADNSNQKEPIHDTMPSEPSPHPLSPIESHKTVPIAFSISLSPAVILFYTFTLIVLFLISYRFGIWYRVKVGMRRWWRKGVGQGKWKKYGDDVGVKVNLEEGIEEEEFSERTRGRLGNILRILSSVRGGVFGTRQTLTSANVRNSESHFLKNGFTNGHANTSVNGHTNKTSNSDPFDTFPLELTSNSNANPNSVKSTPLSARNVNRSASLPVPSVSTSGTSGRSTPQSFMFSTYSSSPTASASTTPFSYPNPPASASTALSTILTNPLVQSRSRNSSQVSLTSIGMTSGNASFQAQTRSRNSSQETIGNDTGKSELELLILLRSPAVIKKGYACLDSTLSPR
ncbi:hypothetical protein Clacol_006624 [Clathrus columnatus]|uniref:Uncharacterized protein n=1 Tax=Clathrus columnatus TaxID=1419009 RepID=A0AAV5AF66_9AGAM|nr:hypothetical protein Clacol_006624 [Clathrus columnatus]